MKILFINLIAELPAWDVQKFVVRVEYLQNALFFAVWKKRAKMAAMTHWRRTSRSRVNFWPITVEMFGCIYARSREVVVRGIVFTGNLHKHQSNFTSYIVPGANISCSECVAVIFRLIIAGSVSRSLRQLCAVNAFCGKCVNLVSACFVSCGAQLICFVDFWIDIDKLNFSRCRGFVFFRTEDLVM